MEFVLERYNYWIIILLMMGGLYIVFESENMIKKLVGLGIFQTSVLFLYVTLGKTAGGTAPILIDSGHGGHGEEHHGETVEHGAAASAAHESQHATNEHHETPFEHDHNADAAGALSHDADAHVDEVAEAYAPVDRATDSVHGGAGDALHVIGGDVIYSNPLPHVLMLTAIVVGVATLSVGLSLVVRIREAYGTIEMDEVRDADIAEGESEGETA